MIGNENPMRRIILISLALITTALTARAQEISLQAPSTVEAGVQFRVRYTVSAQDATNFTPSDFKGFEVIYGPSTSRQSSFQIINGQTSSSSTVTYSYVLVASKPGTYTLTPATAQAGGKTISSTSQEITVLSTGTGGSSANSSSAGNASGSSHNRRGGNASQPSSTSNTIAPTDLFMTATASRTNVYKQEAILVTYKLYTLVNITQLDGKLPTLDGFQIQEIDLPRNKEFELEQYKGKNYHAVTWAQYVLFPQKSGDLVIPAINYEGVVQQRNRNLDPIDAFFNGMSGVIELKKTITAPAITIHVKDLPPAPDNFSGAVGTFSLTSSLTPQRLAANEAITLKIDIKGAGNMKLMETPEVPFPQDFETYDAKVSDNFRLTTGGLSGTKSFEYLAVPRHAGDYTIPATQFVYFDTQSKTYKTLATPAYDIHVEKGTGEASGGVSNYTTPQQDITELNQDIRHIHTRPLRNPLLPRSLVLSPAYALCYALPLVLFCLIVALGRKSIKSKADITSLRAGKANKVARKRLKTAAKLLAQHNGNDFYDEVLRALNGYLTDKFALQQADLNKDNLAAVLLAKGVGEQHVQQLLNTLNNCEFARYAPGDPQQSMDKTYKAAVSLISQLEA